MRLGRAVTHIDFVIRGLQEVLADRRRQALPQHDGVALAVLQTLDTDLLVLVRDRGARRARHGDIGGEIGLARKRLGEGEADARISRFVVDLVVEDAEAVLRAHRLVNLPDIEIVAPVKRSLQGVERAEPGAVPRQKIAEGRQRCRLGVGRHGALIGGVSGDSALGDQIPAVVGLRVVGLDRDIGVAEPVRRILRRRGHGGRGELRGDVEVARDNGGGGRLAQIVRSLARGLRADLAGLGLQRRRNPHRVACHVLVDIGLDVGGQGGSHEKERDEDGAQSLDHGQSPRTISRLMVDNRRSVGPCSIRPDCVSRPGPRAVRRHEASRRARTVPAIDDDHTGSERRRGTV